MLNILAIAVYLVVAGLCAWAAMRMMAQRRHWLTMAFGFLVLCAVRAGNLEELARAAARSWIGNAGLYGQRGEFQSLATAGLTILLGLAVLLGLWAWSRRRTWGGLRAVTVSRLALLGFVPLYAMRLISFHFTDAILYGGPVHLNWLFDLGLAATVAACAVATIRAAGRAGTEPASRRPRRG